MTVSFPRSTRRRPARFSGKGQSRSIAQILREAYHRHTRESITLKAVKRYLG